MPPSGPLYGPLVRADPEFFSRSVPQQVWNLLERVFLCTLQLVHPASLRAFAWGLAAPFACLHTCPSRVEFSPASWCCLVSAATAEKEANRRRRSALTGLAGPSLNRPDYVFNIFDARSFRGSAPNSVFSVAWVLSNGEISTLLRQHLIQTSDAQLCFDLRAAWNAPGPLLLRLSTLQFIASVYESHW